MSVLENIRVEVDKPDEPGREVTVRATTEARVELVYKVTRRHGAPDELILIQPGLFIANERRPAVLWHPSDFADVRDELIAAARPFFNGKRSDDRNPLPNDQERTAAR